MKKRKQKKITKPSTENITSTATSQPSTKSLVKPLVGKSTKDLFKDIEAIGVFKVSFGEKGTIKLKSEMKLSSSSLRILNQMKDSGYPDKFHLKTDGININFTLENYQNILKISQQEKLKQKSK